jgi:trehalose 6-phosphate phosphatase
LTQAALPPPPPVDPDRTSLFLDLDGTLAEIAPRPEDVAAEPARSRVLAALGAATGGRVAVLTGRTLEEADRILDGAVAAVSAVHGLVRRLPDGAVVAFQASPKLPEAARTLETLARGRRGLIVEDKGVSVALHYRQAPEAEGAVRETTGSIARTTGLVVQDGAMVSELRTAGPHKGDALRAFMGDAPFAGGVPVMVGDDLTDEDAFAAAEALGGYGVLVGPPRPTRARYRLGAVAEVLAWLDPEARP